MGVLTALICELLTHISTTCVFVFCESLRTIREKMNKNETKHLFFYLFQSEVFQTYMLLHQVNSPKFDLCR